MFAQTRFSVGIGFNQAPAVYASNIPPCPGPGYTWVDGYWSQNFRQPVWIAGYWSAPVFNTGFGIAPRFDEHFRGGDNRGRDFDRGRNFNGRDGEHGRDFHAQNGRSNGHDDHGKGNGFRGR